MKVGLLYIYNPHGVMQFANKYRLQEVFDCSLQKHRKGARKPHITSNKNLHSNQKAY